MRSIKSKMTESDSRLGECLSLFSKRNVKWWLFAFLLTFKGWDQNQFRPRWFFSFAALKERRKYVKTVQRKEFDKEKICLISRGIIYHFIFLRTTRKKEHSEINLCVFLRKLTFFCGLFLSPPETNKNWGGHFLSSRHLHPHIFSESSSPSSSSSVLFHFGTRKKGEKRKTFLSHFCLFCRKFSQIPNDSWNVESRKLSGVEWKKDLFFLADREEKNQVKKVENWVGGLKMGTSLLILLEKKLFPTKKSLF